MGGKCPHRKVSKRRYSHKTARVKKFVTGFDDSVYELLHKPDAERRPPWNGPILLLALRVSNLSIKTSSLYNLYRNSLTLFYLLILCSRYFKSKRHKKRVKLMNGPAPHNQYDADLAAGMGLPDNGPKLIWYETLGKRFYLILQLIII